MAKHKSTAKVQLAKLRKRGLTRAKPKGRPGGSAYATLRKLAGVLEKKVQPIKLSKAAKRRYGKDFPIAAGKALVPVGTGERVRLTKSGELRRTKTVGQKKYKFTIVPGERKAKLVQNLPGNENTIYRFHYKQGFVKNVIGKSEAERMLTEYDVSNFIDNIEVLTEAMFDAA